MGVAAAGNESAPVASTQPARDQSPAEPAAAPDLIRQAPLVEARAALEEAAATTGVDGMASIVTDHEASRLDLFWKGTPPAQLSDAIAEVRETFEVVIHGAPHSRSEVFGEIRRILEVIEQVEGMDHVVGAQAKEDMSGIRVLVDEMPTNPAAVTEVLDSRMPLTVEVPAWGQPELAQEGWRWDDAPPWTGGKVIERTLLGIPVGRCSTAFTARTSDDSIRGVFSARHCGVQENWRTPVGHGPVGVSNVWFEDIDVMGIFWQTDNPAYLGFEGRVFSGDYNGFDKTDIVGSGWSSVGELVCTSGGFSGIDCRQLVTQRNIFLPDFGGPLFLTEHLDEVAAVGEGDSGGPVFEATFPLARGVISAVIPEDAGGNPRPSECVGHVPEGRLCSDWALHAELQPVLDTLDMQVIHYTESDSPPTVSRSPANGPANLKGDLASVHRLEFGQ